MIESETSQTSMSARQRTLLRLRTQQSSHDSLFQIRAENPQCADCHCRDPEWASLTLGVLICANCSGAHRDLGREVSQVKSLVLDNWSDAMIKQMRAHGGNDAVNDVYEKHLDLYPKASSQRPCSVTPMAERYEWIRRKYISREFCEKPTEERKESGQDDVPVRLCDYFLVMERAELHGKQCESVFSAEFSSKVCDRYPATDHSDYGLSPAVGMFVFPRKVQVSRHYIEPEYSSFALTNEQGLRQYGCTLYFWEQLSPMEVVALCSEAESETSKTSETDFQREIYSPKCIIILSQWPFIIQFLQFLKVLYRISRSEAPLPIERYISHFVKEVPVPPAGKVQVQCSVGDQVLIFRRSAPNQVPDVQIPQLTLFRCLSIDNVLRLFAAVLMEQKILFMSRLRSVLMEASEVLLNLLFPLHYQGVYMPLLPRKLTDFLMAPVPFIAGVNPDFIEDWPDEVVFVDLDNNTVTIPDEVQLVPLPHKAAKKLRSALKDLVNFVDAIEDGNVSPSQSYRVSPIGGRSSPTRIAPSRDLEPLDPTVGPTLKAFRSAELVNVADWGYRGAVAAVPAAGGCPSADQFPVGSVERSQAAERRRFEEVQAAFMRFFTYIFRNYRDHIAFSADGNAEFETAKFIAGESESSRSFFASLTQTQTWSYFIGERLQVAVPPTKSPHKARATTSPTAPVYAAAAAPEIVLFDELVREKLNRSKLRFDRKGTPFLKDTSLHISKTFMVPPVTSPDISQEKWTYPKFPRLKPELFGKTTPARLFVSTEELAHIKRLNALCRGVTEELVKARWSDFMKNIILVQKCVRRHLHRKRYLQLRNTIIMLQQRFRYRRMRKSAILIQRTARTFLDSRSEVIRARRRAAVCMQSVWRGKFARKECIRRRSSFLCLQRWIRTALTRRRFLRVVATVRRVQARARARTVRLRYIHTRHCAVVIQAVVRGHLTRKAQRTHLRRLIGACRREMATEWRSLKVPLIFRSQFWIKFEAPTFLHLAVHKQEAQRLELITEQLKEPAGPAMLSKSEKYLADERKSMYTQLKHHMNKPVIDELYKDFAIQLKSKRKKQRLLDALWVEGSEDVSAKIVLLILDGEILASLGSCMTSAGDANVWEQRKVQQVHKDLHFTLTGLVTSLQKQSVQNSTLRVQLDKQRDRAHTLALENSRLRALLSADESKSMR
eukprot:821102_1